MNSLRFRTPLALLGFTVLSLGLAGPAAAEIKVQCPGDNNGDAVIDSGSPAYDNVKCMHISGGDGFTRMANDGEKRLYVFGFSNLTGLPLTDAISQGQMRANQPSPPIAVDEGDDFYLTLTNVGMLIRPDLFDGHTVHYHGFPEASGTFDGVPDVSFAINQAASLTYFYHNVEPGTYMYHCHVEATEHMQMGMLGELHVHPAQNKLPEGTLLDGPLAGPTGYTHHAGNTYVYNDGDGSTFYDVESNFLLASYDSNFHDASEAVQPLPFANMKDNYPVINGRGYPDTVETTLFDNGNGDMTQRVNTLIEASAGQKVLIRMANLSVTRAFTIQLSGGPKFRVVGSDARINRGRGVPQGKDLSYETTAVHINGGETYDAIVEIPTTAVPGDKYVLYTTNMNYLSNGDEDYGGLMTEIRIN